MSTRAVNGASAGALTSAVHPAASAEPTFLVIIAAGKFYGAISSQTPTDCFNAIARLPGIIAAIVSSEIPTLPRGITERSSLHSVLRLEHP
jgi:hypothetical protein